MRLFEAPEVRFLHTPEGIATAAAVSVAALVGVFAWARRGGREERKARAAIVASAAGATALGVGVIEVARRQGWMHGAYFNLPTPVQWAFNGPVSLAFYTGWLAGYRALSERAAHPYRAYAAVSAAYVPLALVGGRWELSRGYYQLGNGYKLAYNAALTVPLIWAPVLMYEGLREFMSMRPAPLPPAAPKGYELRKKRQPAAAAR